ncbi:hypothetical protein GH714_010395 [Hevea brasiliensis]|uniref:Plant disease resistance WDH domain-containing protein n=1 Tax=Hevea brasiliensis TaxID=3981 RepID=A0A6A6MHS6_HEVBR|nr:hypothetical protein GH714_010395 [Hevea brasiliensis]
MDASSFGIVVLTKKSFRNPYTIEELRFLASKKNLVPIFFDLTLDDCLVRDIVEKRGELWEKHGGELWLLYGGSEKEWKEAVNGLSQVDEWKLEAQEGKTQEKELTVGWSKSSLMEENERSNTWGMEPRKVKNQLYGRNLKRRLRCKAQKFLKGSASEAKKWWTLCKEKKINKNHVRERDCLCQGSRELARQNFFWNLPIDINREKGRIKSFEEQEEEAIYGVRKELMRNIPFLVVIDNWRVKRTGGITNLLLDTINRMPLREMSWSGRESDTLKSNIFLLQLFELCFSIFDHADGPRSLASRMVQASGWFGPSAIPVSLLALAANKIPQSIGGTVMQKIIALLELWSHFIIHQKVRSRSILHVVEI